jgi:hypothetical protein
MIIRDKFGNRIYGALDGGGNPTQTVYQGNPNINQNVQSNIIPIPLNNRNITNGGYQFQANQQNSPDTNFTALQRRLAQMALTSGNFNPLDSAIRPFQQYGTNEYPTYMQNVRAYQDPNQYPNSANFFHQGNSPIQWLGKVAQDTKQRGLLQGAEDMFNPILMNPYVRPITEPITGAIRAGIYQSGLSKLFPFLKNI